MTTRQKILVLFIVVLMLVGDWMVLRKRWDAPSSTDLHRYNASEIAKYDGTKEEQPVLLALDGLVYDVSAGRADFYDPGMSYHYLVGKDASNYLHIFGADLIKKKYPVVGIYTL